MLHMKQTTDKFERDNKELHIYHQYLDCIAECACLCEGGYPHTPVKYKEYSEKLIQHLEYVCDYKCCTLDELQTAVKACNSGELTLDELLQELRSKQSWFIPNSKTSLCFSAHIRIFVNNGSGVMGCTDYRRLKPMETVAFSAYVDCAEDYSEYLVAIYKNLYKAIYELDSVVGVGGKPEFRHSSFQCDLTFITPEEYMKLPEQHSAYTLPRVEVFYTYRPDLIQSCQGAWIARAYRSLEEFSDLFRECVQNSTLEFYRNRNLHRRK